MVISRCSVLALGCRMCFAWFVSGFRPVVIGNFANAWPIAECFEIGLGGDLRRAGRGKKVWQSANLYSSIEVVPAWLVALLIIVVLVCLEH